MNLSSKDIKSVREGLSRDLQFADAADSILMPFNLDGR